jgi:Xaa-Pro aminopeptidase
MRMKNTALLTGPYDWDPALLPLAEFEGRLASVRRALAGTEATALLVHGNSVEHGALAYLTGFTPKLGPAFVLVPRDGPLRILASGGVGMMSSAKLLTWVEDVRPIGNLRNTLNDWLAEVSGHGHGALAVWGGNIMARRPYLAVADAVQPFGKLIEIDDALDPLRRRKSPIELGLLREACRILGTARIAFERAVQEGAGARSAALAAESSAYAQGAQDIRILASVRDGGPPLPFVGSTDLRADPLLACLAVRFSGYWAEGLVTVSRSPHGAVTHAQAAIAAMLREVRPGATPDDLRRIALQVLPPYRLHPSVQPSFGNGIGLSFEESPIFRADKSSVLEPGSVYTLRCGTTGEGNNNAIASAMVAVGESGNEVLWSTAEPSSSL